MKKWEKGIWAAVVMAASLFCAAEAEAAKQETVYPGVFIETTDVSGMTEAEVKSAVEALSLEWGQAQITLHMNGNAYTTSAQSLGYTWTNESVVTEALEYGKRGNVVSRYKQKKDLEQNSTALKLEGVVDEASVQTILETNCLAFNQEAQPHALAVEGGEIVQIPGVIGVDLDVPASVAEITRYMNEEWQGGEADIDLCVTTTEPGGDVEMLSKVTDKMGSGSTDYSSSSDNRKTNVANAVSKINGTILYPGESFSVLDAVLPFDIDNGYAAAASYSQGEVVESIGGGVCQVSTTLYLALLRAEIQIDQRFNHSMLVSYVKPAFDAAVAEGSKDLIFTNNTEAPIYIYGAADGEMVSFSIFGMDTRSPDREIWFENEVIEDADPKVKMNTRLWKFVNENGETTKVAVNRSVYYKSNAEEDREAAQVVNEQISAIGEVTLEDEAAIASAEAAYSALTDSQKEMVGNAGELVAAREALNALKAAAAQATQTLPESAAQTVE